MPWPLVWVEPEEYAYPNESIWDIELICTNLPGNQETDD